MSHFRSISRFAGLALAASVIAMNAHAAEVTVAPVAPTFPSEGKIKYVARDSILEFKALP